ncbi:MAG: MBL fold metallo-hydrolase [Nitrospirae bacterium]|nr:MAG: MBL fold metallo-hydrolase [Nitrospirota bacterium]
MIRPWCKPGKRPCSHPSFRCSQEFTVETRPTQTLEDEFCDIIKKARCGQGYTVSDLARLTGLTTSEIQHLEHGARLPTSQEIRRIGHALGLNCRALEDIVLHGWHPDPLPGWLSHQVIEVDGSIGGYAVKGYVLYDAIAGAALCIDTAYNAPAMLEVLERQALRLLGICLTHGHADHAGGLDRILQRWPVPVYLGRGDWSLLPWKPAMKCLHDPADGESLQVGTLTVRFLVTPGHTPGGLCYYVTNGGKNPPVCFVGDTLFAGSIGRANPFSLYSAHLTSVRHRVLGLPRETVLLPGHGPGTTVEQEIQHNPFV